jgi:hypothetical protein
MTMTYWFSASFALRGRRWLLRSLLRGASHTFVNFWGRGCGGSVSVDTKLSLWHHTVGYRDIRIRDRAHACSTRLSLMQRSWHKRRQKDQIDDQGQQEQTRVQLI